MLLKYLDKKGSIVDPIFLGAYILAISMTIFIALIFWTQFQTTMEDTITPSVPGYETMLDTMSSLRTSYFYMDYMIPILIGALLILSVILAYRSSTSAILAPWAIIVWGIAMMMSAIYTNIYIDFTATFPTIYSEMALLNFAMENLKWITLFWLAIITLVMFRKNTSESSNSNISAMREGFI